MREKVSGWIVRNEITIFAICLTILLRIPSWFEPYWYGDEAIYLTIGQSLLKGVRLYSQIHDNKPPLLYLVAAVANGELFWFKFIATFWTAATVGVFAGLIKKITPEKMPVAAATLLFALVISWPKLEGNIANAELFFLLPTVIAAGWLWIKDLSPIRVIAAGAALGIAAMFKVPAILELAVWPLYWLVSGNKKWLKYSVWLITGAVIPIGISLAASYANGTLGDYLTAAWKQNIPYLNSWGRGETGAGIFNLKNRTAILAVSLAVIYGLARKWGKNATLISAWIAIGLYAALLSGRPYPHYLLQMVPATVLAIAITGLWEIPKLVWTRPRKTVPPGWLIQIAVLAAAGWAIGQFGFYNYPVVGYYGNFLSWAANRKSQEAYIAWFGNQQLINYQVASAVEKITRPDQTIFVWGEEAMIYALTRRSPASKYIVRYHIKDFREGEKTMQELSESRPAVVVSYGAEEELPGFVNWLRDNYQPEQIIEGVKIYSRRG